MSNSAVFTILVLWMTSVRQQCGLPCTPFFITLEQINSPSLMWSSGEQFCKSCTHWILVPEENLPRAVTYSIFQRFWNAFQKTWWTNIHAIGIFVYLATSKGILMFSIYVSSTFQCRKWRYNDSNDSTAQVYWQEKSDLPCNLHDLTPWIPEYSTSLFYRK